VKNIVNLSGIFIIAISFFSSCTVEKRKYVSGYNIQWKNSNHGAGKKIVQLNRPYSSNKKISGNQPILSHCTMKELETETAALSSFTTKKSSGIVSEYANDSPEINTKGTGIYVPSKNISKENNLSGIFGLLSVVLLVGIAIVATSIVGNLAVVIISVLALAAIAFAIIGIRKGRKLRGFALTTLIIAGIALALFILLLLFPLRIA
jgi:hypothetical protein